MPTIPIDKITIPTRLREIDEGKVVQLAESISLVGLLNPIIINEDHILIAGNHRLQAHRLLEKDSIETKIISNDSVLCQLCEVDENLIRNDLNTIQMGEHIVKREELLTEMGLRAQSGDNQYKSQGAVTVSGAFTSAKMAERSHISERSFRRNKQIVQGLSESVRDRLRHTEYADSTSSLLALSNEPPDIQAKVVDILLSQPAKQQGKPSFVKSIIRQVNSSQHQPKSLSKSSTIKKAKRFLIIDPSSRAKFPNLALMKLARWCEINGYEYEYLKGTEETLTYHRMVNGERITQTTKQDIIPIIEPDKIFMSCVFSYNSQQYLNTYNYYSKLFPDVPWLFGGAFPTNCPDWFERNMPNAEIHKGLYEPIERLIPKYAIEPDQETIILHSSRGCNNQCNFCTVPKIEGKMLSYPSIRKYLEAGKRELPNAKSVCLYDNNYTIHKYFDDITAELKEFGLPVDIHGLHVESFTEHQAELLSDLKWAGQGQEQSTPYIRFSFDKPQYRKHILKTLKLCKKHKIQAEMFCYLLFNYKDSPRDFYDRLLAVQDIVDEVGKPIYIFPQRYAPLNSLVKNIYVGEKWDADLVSGCVKLETTLRGFIPITRSQNWKQWIGHSYEEFEERSLNMIQKVGYKLEKTKTL